MDYSTSIHDDAPWGSSPVASPQRQSGGHEHSRSESNGSSIEAPQSPTYGTRSFERPVSSSGGSVAAEEDEIERPDTAESVAIDPELALAGHQQQQAQLAAAAQPKEPRRQQASLYKLQAKITGLERTGRKDPILRFDVHVRQYDLPHYQLRGFR